MKSSIDQQEESLSTTTEEKNKLQIKENKHLFNHIGKLTADHDVTISNTMIKITYKKALKDQNAVENTFDYNTDQVLKNKSIEAMNLCNADISIIANSPNHQTEGKNVLHSTPKQADSEKTKKYINGLNLLTKPNNSEGKSSAGKVQQQKTQEDGASNPKKLKASKQETEKRFNNGLVKTKNSISQKSDAKKLSKGSYTKVKKLENGVKKKMGVDKKVKKVDGVKQKVESECLVKNKFSIDDFILSEGSQNLEEIARSGYKRPLMLVDPDLPSGWSRFIRIRNKGTPHEQKIVYIVNPQGRKFRFKWKLRKYLKRTQSTLDVDQFFFGLYPRQKPWNGSVMEIDEDKSKKTEIPMEVSVSDSNEVESEPSAEAEDGIEDKSPKSNVARRSKDRREILSFDPDLPFGWKRIIHSNGSSGRKQVHIISPDGKIFRRKYRLNEYLVKHQYTHNLDRFYFGLYPKKEGSVFENLWKGTETKTPNLVKLFKSKNSVAEDDSTVIFNKTSVMNDLKEFRDESKMEELNSPMFDDPNLPEGWKRYLKMRSCGESAGRMEVVIISPDGRRHRTRKHLEHYLKQNELDYKAEDFDFTVFGRSNPNKRLASTSRREPEAEPEPEPEPEPVTDVPVWGIKKKTPYRLVPDLDINSLKESPITPEGHLINTVNGLMTCSGISSTRNERRQTLPRKEHEKQLKSFLSSESCPVAESSVDGSNVPTYWVQRLVKCRSSFRILEPDAVSKIAEATKEFLKYVSLKALNNSEQPENGLRYEDIAELVNGTECLSFLKTLIPKKITFREYIKLNRPKPFLSFT